ncbi:hypothetical protein PABG_11204 [Paracoccidioides brasiliensis Pb03]|nr:hypothetical protein PABG_11204 [Paracoccidioides brasiliensis Pb03]
MEKREVPSPPHTESAVLQSRVVGWRWREGIYSVAASLEERFAQKIWCWAGCHVNRQQVEIGEPERRTFLAVLERSEEWDTPMRPSNKIPLSSDQPSSQLFRHILDGTFQRFVRGPETSNFCRMSDWRADHVMLRSVEGASNLEPNLELSQAAAEGQGPEQPAATTLKMPGSTVNGVHNVASWVNKNMLQYAGAVSPIFPVTPQSTISEYSPLPRRYPPPRQIRVMGQRLPGANPLRKWREGRREGGGGCLCGGAQCPWISLQFIDASKMQHTEFCIDKMCRICGLPSLRAAGNQPQIPSMVEAQNKLYGYITM